MNANGEVLGLIQKSASEEDKESYAIGASYGESLSISPYAMLLILDSQFLLFAQLCPEGKHLGHEEEQNTDPKGR